MTRRGEARAFLDESVFRYDGDECLPWPFQRTVLGYGLLKLNGSKTTVSRYICGETYGPPPTPKHEAAHSCGNSFCCNPNHLSWKTHKENEADKLVHNTRCKWERHGRAKLKIDSVREIRSLSGKMSQAKIGEQFGVSQSLISLIHLEKKWVGA